MNEHKDIDDDNEEIIDVDIKPVEYTVQDIFTPIDGKDMKIDYPELVSMEEFDNMNNADIKFCWYFACKSSPFLGQGISDEERLFNSIQEAYGKDYLANKTAVSLLKNEFSSEILAGINRMKILSPSLRSRANAMMSKILDNMDVMINIPKSNLIAMDSGQKKSFVSLCVDVSNNLPHVINQLEGGFSLSKASNKKKQGLQTGGNNTSGNPLSTETDNLMDSIVSTANDKDEVY